MQVLNFMHAGTSNDFSGTILVLQVEHIEAPLQNPSLSVSDFFLEGNYGGASQPMGEQPGYRL